MEEDLNNEESESIENIKGAKKARPKLRRPSKKSVSSSGDYRL